jgi:hypothetical protein
MHISLPTMEEMYGWMYDPEDDNPIVTESDISIADEIVWEDELWQHNTSERDAEWLR